MDVAANCSSGVTRESFSTSLDRGGEPALCGLRIAGSLHSNATWSESTVGAPALLAGFADGVLAVAQLGRPLDLAAEGSPIVSGGERAQVFGGVHVWFRGGASGPGPVADQANALQTIEGAFELLAHPCRVAGFRGGEAGAFQQGPQS